MSDTPPTIVVNGMRPDYLAAQSAEFFDFVSAALKAANGMPKDDSHWALEIDNIPVLSHNEIVGFLVISEADGRTFDFCRAIPEADA